MYCKLQNFLTWYISTNLGRCGFLPISVMATTTTHKRSVYLDYNATTPLDHTVLEAITNSLRYQWMNPSSSYPEGKSARSSIDLARRQVSEMIEAESLEEHDSVILVLRKMAEDKTIELTELRPDSSSGAICIDDVEQAIKDNTVLISVMLANNETGIVQPVSDISKLLLRINRRSQILLHTDAAQVIGKLPVSVKDLGVDYLTIVGHKFYGPRIGALFVKSLGRPGGAPLCPMFQGGGQERGYRPGTENTGMIVGLGQASKLVTDNVVSYQTKMASTRDYLVKRLKNSFDSMVIFNNHFPANTAGCLPNTLNISLKGGACFQGNKVLAELSHCQASVGAACHSSLTNRPSLILLACGIDYEVAMNAMRISIGRDTSIEDIDIFIDDLKQATQQLIESKYDLYLNPIQ